MVKLLSCYVECFDVQWKRQVIFWGNLVTPAPSQHEPPGIQFEQNICNISFTLTHLGNLDLSCTDYLLWNHWYLITVGTIVPVATSLSVGTQPLTLVNCDMMVERWTWNWGRMVRQNCVQSVLQHFIDLIFSSQKTLIFELQSWQQQRINKTNTIGTSWTSQLKNGPATVINVGTTGIWSQLVQYFL